MPEYLSPGVYVEELAAARRPIEGVSTSTAGARRRDRTWAAERCRSWSPATANSRAPSAARCPSTNSATGPRALLSPALRRRRLLHQRRQAPYVTRVLPDEARARAQRDMMFADPAVLTPGDTVLLRARAARQRHRGDAAAAVRAGPDQPRRRRLGAHRRRQPQRIPQLAATSARTQRHVALDAAAAPRACGGRRWSRWPSRPTPRLRAAGRSDFTSSMPSTAGTNELRARHGGDVATLLAALLPPAPRPRTGGCCSRRDSGRRLHLRDARRSGRRPAARVWLARPVQTGLSRRHDGRPSSNHRRHRQTRWPLPANVGDMLAFHPIIAAARPISPPAPTS